MPTFFDLITLLVSTAALLFVASATGDAYAESLPTNEEISVARVSPDEKGGYGYRLQYYVAAPINALWRFKTDFENDFLLTNNQLVGHRFILAADKRVVTENRYASAPQLRFLWQTTIHADYYRLEFKLLNAKDCRHEFHYGTIQLSPAGNFTKVTQTAFFSFSGASVWVRYPWNGGMRSTLTKSAEWEQRMAKRIMHEYLIAANWPG